jgi:hypothetical protein
MEKRCADEEKVLMERIRILLAHQHIEKSAHQSITSIICFFAPWPRLELT